MFPPNLIPPQDCTPNRHLVLPLLFRMLYGCGLRISEATNLALQDVDLNKGTLYIRHTKFNKERILPMADSLTERCREYCKTVDIGNMGEPLFLSVPIWRALFRVNYPQSLSRGASASQDFPFGERERPRIHVFWLLKSSHEEPFARLAHRRISSYHMIETVSSYDSSNILMASICSGFSGSGSLSLYILPIASYFFNPNR